MKKLKGEILIIDDSEAELNLCSMAMSEARMHHEIVTFSEATEAFDYISAHAENIFIIISDLRMPLMTGLELLKKINSDYELRMQAIPFILLSNSRLTKDVEQAYAAGAQGYFVKPVEINILSEMCRDIVSYWHNAQMPRD